jgi:hypothetical protein
MELATGGDGLRNGHGDRVVVEDAYLYPLLKSSDLANARHHGGRMMLVPQQRAGEETGSIQHKAPATWRYLEAHGDQLDARRSVIYRKRPRFSVFGIGPYSFTPWKVAISGFYKRLAFTCVGPINGRPVVFDDTVSFLPCETEDEARHLCALLNSDVARAFYESMIFWSDKRPITVALLRRLDLSTLAACGSLGGVTGGG